MYNKPDYSHSIKNGVLRIVDQNLGSMSVTNGIEIVMKDLISKYGGISWKQVIYCDSEGLWDGVRYYQDADTVDFIFLSENDEEKAAIKIQGL